MEQLQTVISKKDLAKRWSVTEEHIVFSNQIGRAHV